MAVAAWIDGASHAVVGAYWFWAALLAVFGLYYLVIVALRSSFGSQVEAPTPLEHPFVTVQIPVCNERYVVARAIEAAATLEWPQDRIEIQVLDDSDDETATIAAHAVQQLRAAGTDIQHVRRPERTGFKAGALNHGLRTARGEVVAIFDADFVPPPDFLERTIPHLRDERVACVQTSWAHLNEDHSWLTRSAAFALDAHFCIEQEVRGRFGLVMSFNATSCVWKRSALEAAGGWPTTTLTEDLDLTLRTLSLGLRFAYLDTPRAPCELPAEVIGFAKQQARWARGGAQNLRLHAARTLRSKTLPLLVRLDALFHLFHYGFQPALVGLFLCSLGSALLDARIDPASSLALGVVAALGPLSLLIDGQRRSHPGRWLSRLWRIIPLTLVGMGISLRVASHFVAGLLPGGGSFERTPKYALRGKQDTWHGLSYVPKADLFAVLETLAGLVANWGAWVAIQDERYGLAATLAAFGLAFMAVAAHSFAEQLFQPAEEANLKKEINGSDRI